jgi:hypothetical protein
VPEDDKKHKKTWGKDVEDVSKELDPKRIVELSQELIKPLDEETTDRKARKESA